MNATMEIIRAKYPDKLVLSPEELGSLLHMTPPYIRKAVRAGSFPIPWRRIGNRIMFPVSAVVAALDGDTPPKKRGPGAPTTAERIAKREQQQRAGTEG